MEYRMLDHLRGMAVFSTVARLGSFRAAASELGISASVVSHHITSLERHLDTPLIYRTTRKLSLTSAGMKLSTSAHAMLHAVESGIDEISQQSPIARGNLKITAPAILQYARFVTRTAIFFRNNPKIELSLTFTDHRVNIVEEGIDLAIRVGKLEDSSLISRKLADGKLHLCGSPIYLADKPGIEKPEDLQDLELINFRDLNPTVRLEKIGSVHDKCEIQMRDRLSVNSGYATRQLVQDGCGLAVLPDFFVRDALDNGVLVEVLPKWQVGDYGIYALWPPNSGTNHLRNQFLDFIAAIAKSETEMDIV